MATSSRRRRILEAFRTRLEAIRKKASFLTDAGETIFLGESPSLGTDDPDTALAIVAEEDTVESGQGLGSGGSLTITLPVSIHALAKADLENPLLAQEDIIRDIKKAVELDDRTLGSLVGGLRRGTTTPLDREEGHTVVGTALEYIVVYPETWGDPEA